MLSEISNPQLADGRTRREMGDSFKKEPLAHNFLFFNKRITVSVALETALK